MLSPEQCRAARGWLGWSQQELARRANVGLSTVKDFERSERTPIPNNLAAIKSAIEAAGVELVFGKDGDAIGIARSKEPAPQRPRGRG
jgi:ribosome-binding protein aMBF1 (putative translation factor)